MTTRPHHPLAEQYFAELRRSASRLPRQQRTELLSEIRSHLDSGVDEADSDADVRNMLHALGPPDDIVGASSPPSADQVPTGRLALTISIFGLVLLPTLIPPIALGLVAIVLGGRARRALRSRAQSATVATVAVVISAVAIVIPAVLATLLVTSS